MKKLLILFVTLFIFQFCENATKSDSSFPTCKITSPENDTKILPSMIGKSVLISVDARDGDGIIEEVRFYINGTGVSVDTLFPYNYDWIIPDFGPHTITAVTKDNDFNETESKEVTLTADTTYDSSNYSQTVVVQACHSKEYYIEYNGSGNWVYRDNTSINGFILGNPLPKFEYLKMGNKTFTDCIRTVLGYISFSPYIKDSLCITSNYDPLNIEVKTNNGIIVGNLELPDTISSFQISAIDNINIGESITLSWECDRADFYYLNAGYYYSDGDNTFNVDLDTFIIEKSITFSGDIFNKNGRFDVTIPSSYTGVYPEPGAVLNMAGVGIGFMYYENRNFKWDYFRIDIGTGLPKSTDNNYSITIDKFEKKQEDRSLELIYNKLAIFE